MSQNSMRSVRCGCPLGRLDLAVEVRRCGAVGAELDALVAQSILELEAHELTSAVALDALERKRELLDQSLLKKMHGVGSRAGRVEPPHSQPGAVVDGGELVQPLADLAGVHLDSIPWHGAVCSAWASS